MNTGICTDLFREIPVIEQQEINGGAIPFLALIGAAAVAQIILDWDNFKNGLMGRPEEKQSDTLSIRNL
jgi:hypothetical protein